MIPLYVEDGAAFVWNADDWQTLRASHRICGSLIGSAPSFPRQNDFTGLPMALMSYEAAMLVEQGVSELFELPKITTKPTNEQKAEIKALEEKIFGEQTEAMKRKKIDQLSQKIDIIVAGKRQKLLSKGETDVNIDKQALLQEEINKLQTLTPAHALVHLPTEHNMETERVKVPIETLKPNLLDKMETLRYSVFRDLWQQGYYVTSGSKFGSDFLAYPGDPVKFHATYMVRCVPEPTTNFSPASLVAFGRLSVAVNKLAMLATQRVKVPIETLKPNLLDKMETLRYSVFRDLWQQGYYVTSGSKFGSDFLAYPGDPVKFHATYMVRCVPEPTTNFSPASLVAFGRLSVAVNKLAMLATRNIYGNNIEYQTIQWHDSFN